MPLPSQTLRLEVHLAQDKRIDIVAVLFTLE